MHDTNNCSTSTNIGDVTRAQLRERLLDADFMQPDNPDIPAMLREAWESLTSDAPRFGEWEQEGVDLGVSPILMDTMVGLLREHARDQWSTLVNGYMDLLDMGYDPAFLNLLAYLDAEGVEYKVIL